MAMAEGAVGNASTAPTFALEVVLPDTVQLPPNTTLSAFAVRGAEEEDGLYIFVASLNADKIRDLPTLPLSLECIGEFEFSSRSKSSQNHDLISDR